ncbi:MAG: phosphodiester glycosidase family protein, partial [Acidobacteria bacterium]|nr:phosphodiester glycosidase family protein [Acidobacteriota bacterium]
GVNVWQQSARRWSEAAIAQDREGRILFLFSRSPLTMHDFNALLLGLPLAIVRAMHVEGGPEASLSVHAPGIDLDLAGSYETGFNESDANPAQWPLPNVLTVEAGRR